MTQLLLAQVLRPTSSILFRGVAYTSLGQICRQAEAIRALSQAALTSPSAGSGRAPGELEPL